MKKDLIRLGLILFAITFSVAALLSILNETTKDRIAEMERADKQAAMRAVMAGADSFEQITFESPVSNVSEGYYAKKGGELMGYAILVNPNGFGGTVNMMVGVGVSKEVKGIKIISLNETPGLGTKINDPKFLGQYFGKIGVVKISKDGGDIAAISGATVSSKAATTGVNAALSAVSSLKQ